MGLGSRSQDCCCCISVKAGTLILLYLDLFAVIIGLIALFNGAQTPEHVRQSSYDDRIPDYTPHDQIKNLVGPLFIVCVVLLVIVVAGLFAVGKRKPSLLIPYFILKIIEAIAIILILTPLMFAEKKGLDLLDSPKSYNKVYGDMTGDRDNAVGNLVNGVSNVLYVLIILEILLIILQIHYCKVVYACYKKIEEELAGVGGIIYPPPCGIPYYPLHQPTGVPVQEPVYAC